MSYWEDKVALVTGAGTGIGRGIALELGRLGAAVVVHYNTSAGGAEETVRAIQAGGGRAEAVPANLEHVSECTRLVQETLRAYGGIDILVNNAALSIEAAFFDVSEALWDRIQHVNLRAPFFCRTNNE
jgi:NAD(P)-dependent dehydrogenase (short-subunit alcohol dehydrogenase family)